MELNPLPQDNYVCGAPFSGWRVPPFAPVTHGPAARLFPREVWGEKTAAPIQIPFCSKLSLPGGQGPARLPSAVGTRTVPAAEE